MTARRTDVIDELLAAMGSRDHDAVLAVLVQRQPTHDEVAAAKALRRLDMWLDEWLDERR